MNNLTVFDFKSNEIRVVMDGDNNPWFVAQDICNGLEIQDSAKAVRDINNQIKSLEKSAILSRTPDTISNRISLKLGKQKRELVCVNETGVNLLIFQSRKKSAFEFKYWVASEVLPSIRKTGEYRLTINEEQQRLIQEAVNRKVYREQTCHQTVYHELKTIFKIAKYNQLPANKFNECMQWLDNGYQKGTQNSKVSQRTEVGVRSLVSHMFSIHNWFESIQPALKVIAPDTVKAVFPHMHEAKVEAWLLNDDMQLGVPRERLLESQLWGLGYNDSHR